MFGRLSVAQKRIIRPLVKDRVVHDLGAGQQKLSKALRLMGARQVVAVDSKPPRVISAGVTTQISYFADYLETPEVALVSWPVNYDGVGLADIVDRTDTVLYLGTNVGGTACGGRDLWEVLSRREVLAYEADPINTLIVYGAGKTNRMLYGEELAALNVDRQWMFEEAEKASKQGVSRSMLGTSYP